jgi:NADP-dependent 3-hydroxy acid dehydrogenase YdfG
VKDKKIVLITGASSGMGKQTALYLASCGFIVYATTRTPNKLNDIKQENIIPIKLDLTNQNNINSVIQTIVKNHKKIDILINNAGYGLISTVEDITEELWMCKRLNDKVAY